MEENEKSTNELIEELRSIVAEAKQKLETISEAETHLKTITEKLSGHQTVLAQISDYLKTNDEEDTDGSKLDELVAQTELASTNSKLINQYFKEISEFHDRVKGILKNGEVESEGYEQLFEGKKIEFEKLISTSKSQQKAVIDEIKSLLPQATSVGLAKAFKDRRDSYYWPTLGATFGFIIILLTMIWFGGSFVIELKNKDLDFQAIITMILERSPFFLPAVWLAVFLNRKLNQFRRLQEEYAFKETYAMSYEGHKGQIEKMDSANHQEELQYELLSKLVEVTSYNPSELLDRSTHDEPLLVRLLEIWKGKSETDGQK